MQNLLTQVNSFKDIVINFCICHAIHSTILIYLIIQSLLSVDSRQDTVRYVHSERWSILTVYPVPKSFLVLRSLVLRTSSSQKKSIMSQVIQTWINNLLEAIENVSLSEFNSYTDCDNSYQNSRSRNTKITNNVNTTHSNMSQQLKSPVN